MQSDVEMDRLRQENKAKSQLIERVNLHALALQEKNTELNKRIILIDKECSQYREENNQLVAMNKQLMERNNQLMGKLEKEEGVMTLLRKLPRAFIKAVCRRMQF